jgi:hypothetical protein
MAGPDSEVKGLAQAAAERIARDDELRRQLTLLPDEVPERVEEGEARGPGRPKGAKGKVSSQVRDWLAHRGYRMPEEVLGEMLGMARGDTDLMAEAMIEAERVLAWAGDGARNVIWNGTRHVELEGPWQATPEQRLEVFKGIYAMKLRAAEALLPFGAPKASPEAGGGGTTVVMMPVMPGQQAPRDVTPGPAQAAGMAPWEAARARRAARTGTEQDQWLSDAEDPGEGGERRTPEEDGGKTDG